MKGESQNKKWAEKEKQKARPERSGRATNENAKFIQMGQAAKCGNKKMCVHMCPQDNSQIAQHTLHTHTRTHTLAAQKPEEMRT